MNDINILFQCFCSNATLALLHQLSTSFTKVCDIHKYSTRAASLASLALPQPRLEMLKRSLLYSGPLIWNALSTLLKQAPCIHAFKKLYKKEFSELTFSISRLMVTSTCFVL